MFRNYFKIAWRNLWKNKVYALINITGLSFGLATTIIIMLFVADDLSYDSFQSKAERIALFQQFPNSSSSGSSFSAVLAKRSGVQAVSQLSPQRALISKLNFADYEPNFCLADSNFSKIFDIPMEAGLLSTALAVPNRVAISQKMAIKYFNGRDAIGQTVEVQLANKELFTVVGVFKNIPENSHLKVDFITSSKNKKMLLNSQNDSFWDFAGMTYILLKTKNSFQHFSRQLPAIQKATLDQNNLAWKLSIIPLKEIYLKNSMDDRIKATNAIEFVRLFFAIALCILLLACFNYVNLSIARGATRSKEIGVRKVIGAKKRQLIGQFLGESFLLSAISITLALILVKICLPFFNTFSEKNISILEFINPVYLFFLVILYLLVSILTGLYPAFILSSYKPISVLKSKFLSNNKLSFFRSGMVVFQFAVSALILVATFVVINQLDYIQNKDLGYERDLVITLNLPEQSSESQKSSLQNEILKINNVDDVTRVSIFPGSGIGFNKVSSLSLKNTEIDPTIGQLYVDDKFLKVFKVKLREGRFFSSSLADKQNFVVNNAAVKKFGWKLGQTVGYVNYTYLPDGTYMEVPVNGEIIGIVDDYNQMDLKSPIFPIMMIQGEGLGKYAVKFNNTDYKNGISKIRTIWKETFPNYPFEYSFLNEEFNKSYKKEQNTSKIFGVFSSLAILISCLGLLGLVTFVTEQRNKEIGIRKVLGASIKNIFVLLSKELVPLILTSLIVAIPISYFLMRNWLNDFAFKAEISIWNFMLVGLIIISTASITISYNVFRAALMNPVKSLKTE
jgi:putative ABC transport system permease protein